MEVKTADETRVKGRMWRRRRTRRSDPVKSGEEEICQCFPEKQRTGLQIENKTKAKWVPKASSLLLLPSAATFTGQSVYSWQRKALTARREPGRDQAPVVIADINMYRTQGRKTNEKWVGEVKEPLIMGQGPRRAELYLNLLLSPKMPLRGSDMGHLSKHKEWKCWQTNSCIAPAVMSQQQQLNCDKKHVVYIKYSA